jgi:uncharacterized protein YecE (DUF72 family)
LAKIRIGISGWRYGPWRGVFYPPGLPHRRELEHASRTLPTIEINGSFYSLQRPESYRQWYADTPARFIFSLKGGRYITHMKRLRDIEAPLANYFASGVLALREKLGPVLWQFPPQFRFNPPVFEHFLQLLPRHTGEALSLARRRDSRMKGRAALSIDKERELRHAVEIRNETFLVKSFIDLLRRYHRRACCCLIPRASGLIAKTLPLTSCICACTEIPELYSSSYSDSALWPRWARRIEAWSNGAQPDDAQLISDKRPRKRKSRDVYCYFDNDAKVHAPFDAQRLIRQLKAGRFVGRVMSPQLTLRFLRRLRCRSAIDRRLVPGGYFCGRAQAGRKAPGSCSY